MPTPSAERTRSRRFRSGTRRNKKHNIAHIQICGEPDTCLVHTTRPVFPPPDPMRMRLTRCEQRWVDDVRAGRVHVHLVPHHKGEISKTLRWRALAAIRRAANTARMAQSGTINVCQPHGVRTPREAQKRIHDTVYGIRGHRVMTPDEVEQKRLSEERLSNSINMVQYGGSGLGHSYSTENPAHMAALGVGLARQSGIQTGSSPVPRGR